MNISKTGKNTSKMPYFEKKKHNLKAKAQKSKCEYTCTIVSYDISNDHTLPMVKNNAKI